MLISLLVGFIEILAFILGPYQTLYTQPQNKPDIIVFMIDDMGAMNETGSIDERVFERLPNIRSLFLQNGLRFDKYYGETPLCCPGRAEFLKGEHVLNPDNGVTYNDARLFDPTYSIATALHDDGYYTMMAGKYFNEANLLSDYTPPGWDKVAMHLGGEFTGGDWAVQGQIQPEGFMDRFILNQSLQWLGVAPPAQPIFAYISSHAPHFARGHIDSPWITDVEPQYENDPRCSGIPSWDPPTYQNAKKPNGYPLQSICESLLTVDELVGKVEAQMRSEGRNPIYVLTGDNGMSWGRDGFSMKNVPESTALPLYISGPGISPGHTSALVENIDLAPTLVNLAGGNMPKADGVSFAPVLLGQADTARSWLFEDHPLGGNANGNGLTLTGPWWGMRTSDGWHLVEWPKWRGEALYFDPTDPWEQNNLASQNPDMVSQLKALKPY